MTDHIVQFFRDDGELLDAVRAYLAEDIGQGAQALVIVTEAHRRALAGERVRFLDAARTLAQVMVDGLPDPERFDAVVGDPLRSLAATGRPARAFGEIVGLLWSDGNVMGAINLETLWHDLGSRLGFSLFCAYPDGASASREHPDAHGQVLQMHTGVAVPTRRFTVARSFADTLRAPREARRFIVRALRERGSDEGLIDAAALAVSELATNAIVHARSTFTVTLSADDEAVRIDVRDADPVAPNHEPGHPLGENGRGLSIVNGVARRWGVDRDPPGKVVWVELNH